MTKLFRLEPRDAESVEAQRDYDLAMVRACWEMMQHPMHATAPRPVRNALLESFLLHAMVLLDDAIGRDVEDFVLAVRRFLLRNSLRIAERESAIWDLEAIAAQCEALIERRN